MIKHENGKVTVKVPNDINKIEQGIKALESLIETDTNDYDKEMHRIALETYKKKYEEFNIKFK